MVEHETKTLIAVVRSNLLPNSCIRFLRIRTLRGSNETLPGKTTSLPSIATPTLQPLENSPTSVRGRAPRSLDVLQALPEHPADRGSGPTRWEGVVVAWQVSGTVTAARRSCLCSTGLSQTHICVICYLGICKCHCPTMYRGPRHSLMMCMMKIGAQACMSLCALHVGNCF